MIHKVNSNILSQRLLLDMRESAVATNLRSLRSPFVLALLTAFFSSTIFGVVFPVALLGIASTFGVTVGTASQISAVASAVSVFFALLMSVFSIRFDHKKLLLLGITCIILAALGSALAPTFDVMQIVFALSGIGGVIIGTITYTLIGDFLPIEQRGKAVGLTVAVQSGAFIVGSPLASCIIIFSNWQAAFLWSVVPISVLGLIISYYAIPSKLHSAPVSNSYLSGIRAVALDKSAMACLIASMLSIASTAMGIYIVAFYNSQFNMPITFGAALIMVGAIISVVGGIVAGLLINWRGRKGSIALAGTIATIFGTGFIFAPELWTSVTLRNISMFFGAITMTSFASLSLEQAPKFRATMMSLTSAVLAIGGFLGAFIGSITLNLYNYQFLALILGALSVASIAIIILWTKEPPKHPNNPTTNQ